MKFLPLFDRHYLLAFVISLIVFTGCKKSDVVEDPIPPTENPEPIRVLQSIRTYMQDNELVSDTTSFEYDNEGRVTKKIYGFGNIEKYAYDGDKVLSIKSGVNGENEILREAIYSSDGDSIIISFVPGNTSTDTVQLYYIFNENIQTDFWTYLHFANNCSCSERHLQKEKFYYNPQGNLIKMTMQTLLDSAEGNRFIVTAWDDKINPKRDQPKLNSLILGLNLPLESGSLHNPTKYTNGNGTTTYEVEMTYNSEGYPLTFKMKDQDYIATKLVYNRD